MRYAILSLTFLFCGSCVLAKSQAQNDSQKVKPVPCPQGYFPVGAFAAAGQSSSSKESLYSCMLTAMQEPSLSEAARTSDTSVYRFLFIYGFRTLSVRLALNEDGSGVLAGKLGIFGSSTRLFSQDSIAVSKDQMQKFATLLQKAQFWEMPTEDPQDKSYHMDGAQCVLEGTRNHSYHVVDRWLRGGTDYEQLCRYLMELSPVKVDQDVRSKTN
jgi:hypothetical protein